MLSSEISADSTESLSICLDGNCSGGKCAFESVNNFCENVVDYSEWIEWPFKVYFTCAQSIKMFQIDAIETL